VKRPEPEKETIRRVLPYVLPAAGLALGTGLLMSGWPAGWSAAIGVAVVAGNMVAHGLSLAWAARISPTMMFAVGLGGFFVRLVVIVWVLVLLRTVPWFSAVAFAATVVPATLVLLIAEAKLLSGRMQADLWMFPTQAR
jgi:ATP synthase protein I